MDGNLVSKTQTTEWELEYPRAVLRSRPRNWNRLAGVGKRCAVVRSREH